MGAWTDLSTVLVYIDTDVSSEIYRLHFTVHTHRHQLSLNFVVFFGSCLLVMIYYVCPTGSSRLHWSSVFQIIQGIAHGVKILHDRFIVHLDLKPSNVLLDSDFNPKIADFGVARELNLRGNEYFDDNFVAGTM